MNLRPLFPKSLLCLLGLLIVNQILNAQTIQTTNKPLVRPAADSPWISLDNPPAPTSTPPANQPRPLGSVSPASTSPGNKAARANSVLNGQRIPQPTQQRPSAGTDRTTGQNAINQIGSAQSPMNAPPAKQNALTQEDLVRRRFEQLKVESKSTGQTQPIDPMVEQISLSQDSSTLSRDVVADLSKDNPEETVPKPTVHELAEYARFIAGINDPRNSLDIIVGRSRTMQLRVPVRRVQVEEETVVGKPIIVSPTQISISGKKLGSTVLTLYFEDPTVETGERLLSYLVRVVADPALRDIRRRTLDELSAEINRAFPDSIVEIKLVGERIVITGQAKDIEESNHIFRIVQASVASSNGDRFGRRGEPILIDNAGTANEGSPFSRAHVIGADSNRLGDDIVNLLRIPGEQQVMLQVTVAEINRAAARSIGINFSIVGNTGNQLTQQTGNLLSSFSSAGASGLGGAANVLAAIDNGQVRLAVNALREVNLARSLAEPNLTAINGHTANFQAGGQFPVPIVTGATSVGLQGVQFVPYGVSLQFTPTITDKTRIRLQLAAEVSTRDNGVGQQTQVAGSNVPNITTRNFSSTIELRDGETIAVAGLIQNNFGSQTKRIPWLGDMPYLGRFFAYDGTSCADQELIVLVTPRMVHPLRGNLPALPGHDMLSPDDVEFYLYGRLERTLALPASVNPAASLTSVPPEVSQLERANLIGAVGHAGFQPIASTPKNSTERKTR